MSTEATRRENHNRAARLTFIDKAELFVKMVVREVKGIWAETTKQSIVQISLIALVAVGLVASGFVEGFVDGIL